MVAKGYNKKMANFVGTKESPRVTELFKKAFEKASEALPEYEQDLFAQWLLDAIESDARLWDVALESNPTRLKALVDQALADIDEGRIEPLDLDKL
jgi:hypothetical protein